ncbi:MAG: lysozyme, partial [Pseudomonadota bacterium]
MSRRRVSSDGLALIKRYEGFQPRAVQLNENQWVIGYGHTKTARAGLKVSRADAEAILREYDLAPVEQAVTLSVLAPLNDHEFDALVSFAYSVGVPAFRKSQVLAHMNSGQPLQAAMALLAWRKASVNGRLIVVDALVRRRAAEAALMLSGEDLPSNAPSQLIHPQFDVTALPDAEADWETLENPYSDAVEAIDADRLAESGEALPIATFPEIRQPPQAFPHLSQS